MIVSMCIVGKQFVYLDLKPCWHDNSTDKALLDDSILLCFFSPDMSIYVSEILYLHLRIYDCTYQPFYALGLTNYYLQCFIFNH